MVVLGHDNSLGLVSSLLVNERQLHEREREKINIRTLYHNKYMHISPQMCATYHQYLLEVALLHSERFMLPCPQCSYGVDLTKLECGDGSRSILHILFSVVDKQPLCRE